MADTLEAGAWAARCGLCDGLARYVGDRETPAGLMLTYRCPNGHVGELASDEEYRRAEGELDDGRA